MHIHILCRSCLGSGTRVDVLAHTTTGQALATRPCPDCHGSGHHRLTATIHPTRSQNGT